MKTTIHGVTLNILCWVNKGDKTSLYFSQDISVPDRLTLEKHGVPVFFDIARQMRYMCVDTSRLECFNTNKVINAVTCECGAKAVNSSRHSQWCPYTTLIT